MYLPENNDIPVNQLARIFNNTTTPYKFYWFLSILDSVERRKKTIQKKDLFAGMISNAWYTVNYFKISFGKQDKLQQTIEKLIKLEGLEITESKITIENNIKTSKKKETSNLLNHFNNQVPHWFLSPWFKGANRSKIYQLSKNLENNCIYSLDADSITINPSWIKYLNRHVKILRDFTYWNLSMFLQSRNPSVPNIPNKIIKPAIRNPLNQQRKYFWDIIFRELGSITCIYTGKVLNESNYAVEHFIPFSFVSHDLIWNLLPADPVYNSIKSNKLPLLEKHFDGFFQIQSEAFEIIKTIDSKNRFIDDYYSMFPEADIVGVLIKDNFRDKIYPLVKIASNNGFEYLS